MKIDFLVNIPIIEGMPIALNKANKRISEGRTNGEICVAFDIADAGPNKTYRQIVLAFEEGERKPDPRIELEALITEREGIIAENLQRVAVGSSMAYGSDSFNQIADKIRALAKV